jgi:hypothetical protein
VLLAFFTCGFNFFVLLIGLARGNPHRFEVIEKVAAVTSDGPNGRRLPWVPAMNFASVGATSLAVGLFFVLVVTAYAERLTG